MRGFPGGPSLQRLIFLALAILLALGTTLLISRSLTHLRRERAFDRALTRAERLDREGYLDESYGDVLREAARFARSSRDWHRLFRLAWRQSGAERWRTLDDLAGAAVSAFPRDLTWRKIGSYAAVRRGDHRAAQEYLRNQGLAGEEFQMLQVLAVLDPDRPDQSRAEVLELATDHPEARLIGAVAGALDDPRAPQLWQAWEVTGVAAFARNSALAAAAEGDLPRARHAARAFREFSRDPPGSEPLDHRAAIFLSAWLGEDTWLFRELRALPPREAVLPPILLIQADAHARQGQFEKARSLYRELQDLAPAFSAVPFMNEAVLLARQGRPQLPDVIERGDAHHGHDPEYRLLRASLLAAQGEWSRAREILAGLEGAVLEDDPRAWLLAHLAGLPRPGDPRKGQDDAAPVSSLLVPPERREQELWGYLGRHPEALQVAGVLARHLTLRRDAAGLAELRRRYDPARAPWAAALHLIEFDRQSDPARAREVLPGLFPPAEGGVRSSGVSLWAAHWNESIFALRHAPLGESRQAIQRFRDWFDAANLPPGVREEIETRILLLQAEQARLEDRPADARRLADRAIGLTPDDESLYSYRALLAPRD